MEGREGRQGRVEEVASAERRREEKAKAETQRARRNAEKRASPQGTQSRRERVEANPKTHLQRPRVGHPRKEGSRMPPLRR